MYELQFLNTQKRSVFVCTHQVHKVQGENMDAAGNRGQSADDGGKNAQTTRAKQQVLHNNIEYHQLF